MKWRTAHFERGQTFHNFNDHDYMVLEALSPRNLVVMDMKSGSLTIALVRQSISVIRRMRSLQRTIPQSEYRGSMAFILVPHSQPRISRHTRGVWHTGKIEDIYDYRAKLKQKFYFYQDMSKDDDVPKKLQNDFLHQMYEDFGTIEEDCFYDRLEDGKYDGGFKGKTGKGRKEPVDDIFTGGDIIWNRN